MSGLQLKYLTAAENEFLAEETIVTIVPKFSHPVLHFISGEYGPFDDNMEIDVPLWLAINLRKKDKCLIIVPQWMNPYSLEETIRNEKSESIFQKLPYHYMEIAMLLLSNAKEEIKEYEKVISLLKDLENIRTDKMLVGMHGVADSVQGGEMVNSAQLNDIGALEVLSIKRFFLDSMSMFKKLTATTDRDNNDSVSSMQPTSAATTNDTTSSSTRGSLRRYGNR